MKTTIDLPDSLARRAKEVARDQGVTLREIIEVGLRTELDRRTAPQSTSTFRFRTVSGSGLATGVDPEHLLEHAYDGPA